MTAGAILASKLERFNELFQLRAMGGGLDFLEDCEHGSVAVEDERRARGTDERSSIHRFFHQRTGGMSEQIPRIADEGVSDLLHANITTMGPARIATDRHHIVAGLVQPRRVRYQAVILPIASRCIVFHVNRHDRASREQVSEDHLLGHAILHNFESEISVQSFTGSNHIPSERFGRKPSNFGEYSRLRRSVRRVFDGVRKTLHVEPE